MANTGKYYLLFSFFILWIPGQSFTQENELNDLTVSTTVESTFQNEPATSRPRIINSEKTVSPENPSLEQQPDLSAKSVLKAPNSITEDSNIINTTEDSGKDMDSFFENGTSEQFEFCYKLYSQVLKTKARKSKNPEDLIYLDNWYQNELPQAIKARGKDAHLTRHELVQIMKWKQIRANGYPELSRLVEVNIPEEVIAQTKNAFRKLPNLEQAVATLANLKGVGTTLASAILTAASPLSAPFMADECLKSIPEIEGISYTTKDYLNFVQHIQRTADRLNAQTVGETPAWSPHRVELALWSHYVASALSPEVLDDMPGGNDWAQL